LKDLNELTKIVVFTSKDYKESFWFYGSSLWDMDRVSKEADKRCDKWHYLDVLHMTNKGWQLK
jgi:hypothetical protein